MLRRVLSNLTFRLKTFKMAEILAESPDVSAASNKREFDEKGDGIEPDVKKQKTEAAPMQGRADRKRKVAMLMSYSGAGYYGMQINPGYPSIESTLCEALVAADVIPQEHADSMQKMSFQRAARTDKGVSALGQVVSLKMTLNHENVVEKINQKLPDQIRVMGIKRTTKAFNSKNYCSGRSYIYMLPTFSFAPVEKFLDEEYRVTDDIINRVNEVLQNFKGTHNFHNYTSGIKPQDPSAKRYMKNLECGKPFVRENQEFAIIRIEGQSFMMHHIRKMIGVTISIVRGFAGEELLTKTWGKEKVDIPKAPGLGLMLEQLHYDAYNKKFGSDGMHEPIQWAEYQSAIDEFAEKYIFSNIVKTEKEERSMFNWLRTLHNHSFDVRDGREVTPVYAARRNVDWDTQDKNEMTEKQADPSQEGEAEYDKNTNVTDASNTEENLNQQSDATTTTTVVANGDNKTEELNKDSENTDSNVELTQEKQNQGVS